MQAPPALHSLLNYPIFSCKKSKAIIRNTLLWRTWITPSLLPTMLPAFPKRDPAGMLSAGRHPPCLRFRKHQAAPLPFSRSLTLSSTWWEQLYPPWVPMVPHAAQLISCQLKQTPFLFALLWQANCQGFVEKGCGHFMALSSEPYPMDLSGKKKKK